MLLNLFAFCFVLQVALIIAFVLGFGLTEKFKPLIDMKPFNCRPCLTFWLSIGLGILSLFMFLRYFEISLTPRYMIGSGIIIISASFINFLRVKLNTTIKP